MRKPIALLVSLLALATAAVTGTAVAPAQAAENVSVTKEYSLVYGNTYSKGTVTFYNRSARVIGEQKAVTKGSWRHTQAHAFSGSDDIGWEYSQWTLLGSEPIDIKLTADRPGGADSVRVELWGYINDETVLLKEQTVYRR